MIDPVSGAHIGRFVLVKKGRDAGQIAIIIEHINDSFVFIADGDKRSVDIPKQKNMNHLLLCSYVSPEVRDSILQTGRVTNGKLRYALNKFRSEYLTEEKGDDFNGERRCN
ncbi:KOW domain-containing RNA-binding protein [Caldibacillus lycopersici]|uniref:KOW domain-containing RNA-binding protein n=1 Tax=Perspicuibacillus lycopersici TaxID=1325689 RepID=A0AAE3LPR0_9BACI|nr:KOW domain-containing RNA-binding protein [Perspicuibacillus lycopersici]MCU9615207.1 KOW domain-containing RNA-binding protein [Perspicuibacillus lycopersici]